jgi:hypothetical protein
MPFGGAGVKQDRGVSRGLPPLYVKVRILFKFVATSDEKERRVPMANIDVDFGSIRVQRPQASIEGYPPAQETLPPPPRAARSPQYSRIDAGQLLRTALLVVLCVGAFQIVRADWVIVAKSPLSDSVAVTKPL